MHQPILHGESMSSSLESVIVGVQVQRKLNEFFIKERSFFADISKLAKQLDLQRTNDPAVNAFKKQLSLVINLQKQLEGSFPPGLATFENIAKVVSSEEYRRHADALMVLITLYQDIPSTFYKQHCIDEGTNKRTNQTLDGLLIRPTQYFPVGKLFLQDCILEFLDAVNSPAVLIPEAGILKNLLKSIRVC